MGRFCVVVCAIAPSESELFPFPERALLLITPSAVSWAVFTSWLSFVRRSHERDSLSLLVRLAQECLPQPVSLRRSHSLDPIVMVMMIRLRDYRQRGGRHRPTWGKQGSWEPENSGFVTDQTYM
jgi:hypothetical protein